MRIAVIGHTFTIQMNQQVLCAIKSCYPELEVGVVTPARWRAKDWGSWFELQRGFGDLIYMPIPVFIFNGQGSGYLFDHFRLYAALKKFKPALVHIEQETYSLCAAQCVWVAKRLGAKITVCGYENLDRPLNAIMRLTRRFVVRNTHRMFTISNEGAALLRRYGYSRDIDVISQLGVNPKIFDRTLRLGKKSPVFTIGFLGRIVYEKGIDVLLKACSLLRGRSIKVIICGYGNMTQDYIKLSRDLGISDIVEFRSAVPHRDIPGVLAELDCLVLPSRSTPKWKEQVGHILLEAMAMAIPVVGSDSGGIPSTIARSDCIFPEDDHKKLAQILERIYLSPQLQEELSEYGYRRVLENFTHEKIAQGYVKGWKQVVP